MRRSQWLLNELVICSLVSVFAPLAPAQTPPAQAGTETVQTRALEAAGKKAIVERAQLTPERTVEARADNPDNSSARNGRRGTVGPAPGLWSSAGARRIQAVSAYAKPGLGSRAYGQADGKHARTGSAIRPNLATKAAPTLSGPSALSVVGTNRYSAVAPSTTMQPAALKLSRGNFILGGPAALYRRKLGGPAETNAGTKAGIYGSSQRRGF